MSTPGVGLHSYRIFNIAVFDVLLTIIASMIASHLLGVPLWCTLIFMFALGIVVHRVLGIRTTIDKLLFPG